jgi:anhydro-N-acetylmuramic acid kinase
VYCIGLMSGTSVDGIDAALVEITGEEFDLSVKLLAGDTYAYPVDLRKQILAVCGGAALSIAQLAELDDAIATQFAHAAISIQNNNPTADAIGSHGQTVFHRPPLVSVNSYQLPVNPKSRSVASRQARQPKIGYSLQLGRGEVIANLTGIPTVSNFRAADIAAGGQGAPLVSKIDACLLGHSTRSRCIQNIGGIGNVTYLPPRDRENWQDKICGWDTGPGNALIDLAVAKLTDGQQTFDRDGNWAAQGIPCQEIVEEKWLQQDFFHLPPPKSTGRELFGETYLENCWQEAQPYQLSDADWLATLTELTAAAIAHSYRTFLPQLPDDVLLCGGGSRNRYLRQRLQAQLGEDVKILTTDEMGMSGDFKEAIAFAVLAYWRLGGSFGGNLPQVTGATRSMLLGDIHLPLA